MGGLTSTLNRAPAILICYWHQKGFTAVISEKLYINNMIAKYPHICFSVFYEHIPLIYLDLIPKNICAGTYIIYIHRIYYFTYFISSIRFWHASFVSTRIWRVLTFAMEYSFYKKLARKTLSPQPMHFWKTRHWGLPT